MVETTISDLLSVLPPERRYKLMASRACRVSEARYLHYLLQCARDEVKPTVKNIWVSREGNILPALVTAITKPELIDKWGGEPTSVVIRSSDKRLQGMIVYAGLPLRPMRRDAVYPSEDIYIWLQVMLRAQP